MTSTDKSRRAYGPVMLISGLIGIALFCTVHAVYTVDLHQWLAVITQKPVARPIAEIEPTWVLTPLYILPVLIGLMLTRRLRIVGLIFLTLAVTGAHYLAQTLGIQTLALFPDSEDETALIPFVTVGAVAGATGSAISFAAFALLARDLRDAPHLKLYGISTLGLSLTGALCFLSMMLIEPASNKWILNLYLPWQLLFTLAIAMSFQSRAAEKAI